MANNKTIKIIIAVLSVLLAISLAALIFVTVKLHFTLQTASDTVDDNYITPEANEENTVDFMEKEGNAYAR